MEDTHKTVCNKCYRKTWYETSQPCHVSGCTGTLMVIDNSLLAEQFTPYYENKQRIEVETCGKKIRGYVGKTTGWKPVYILLLRSNSMGSSYTLRTDDKIVGTFNKYL